MALQAGRYVPLDITRIICDQIKPDGAALDSTTKQTLQSVRLLSSTFSTAGAEKLFQQVKCEVNKRLHCEQDHPVTNLAASRFRYHVTSLHLSLVFDGLEELCIECEEKTTNGHPESVIMEALMPWLECLIAFKNKMHRLVQTLGNFSNVKELTITHVFSGQSWERHFLHIWHFQIRSLSNSFPRLPKIKFEPCECDHCAQFEALNPFRPTLSDLTVLWKDAGVITDNTVGWSCDLEMPNMPVLEKLSVLGSGNDFCMAMALACLCERASAAFNRFPDRIFLNSLEQQQPSYLQELCLRNLEFGGDSLPTFLADVSETLEVLYLDNITQPDCLWTETMIVLGQARKLTRLNLSRICIDDLEGPDWDHGRGSLEELTLQQVHIPGLCLEYLILRSMITLGSVRFHSVSLAFNQPETDLDARWASVLWRLTTSERLVELSLRRLSATSCCDSCAHRPLIKAQALLERWERSSRAGHKLAPLSIRMEPSLAELVLQSETLFPIHELGELLRCVMSRRYRLKMSPSVDVLFAEQIASLPPPLDIVGDYDLNSEAYFTCIYKWNLKREEPKQLDLRNANDSSDDDSDVDETKVLSDDRETNSELGGDVLDLENRDDSYFQTTLHEYWS